MKRKHPQKPLRDWAKHVGMTSLYILLLQRWARARLRKVMFLEERLSSGMGWGELPWRELRWGWNKEIQKIMSRWHANVFGKLNEEVDKLAMKNQVKVRLLVLLHQRTFYIDTQTRSALQTFQGSSSSPTIIDMMVMTCPPTWLNDLEIRWRNGKINMCVRVLGHRSSPKDWIVYVDRRRHLEGGVRKRGVRVRFVHITFALC